MTKISIDADLSNAKAYLRQPYTRLLVPEDDGTFRAEIMEFPGCIATGDSTTEALSSLERVACSWIMSALAKKQTIPVPIDNRDFSGKVVARFPKSLHKKATKIAEIEGVSLNQLIVTSLAQYIGEKVSIQTQHTVSVSPVPISFFQELPGIWWQKAESGSIAQSVQTYFSEPNTLSLPKSAEN